MSNYRVLTKDECDNCAGPLRPPLSEGMEWRYCPYCKFHVHEPCGKKICTCNAKRSLASTPNDEVVSPNRRPQEGHDMATATKKSTAKKSTAKKSTGTKAAAAPKAASNGEAKTVDKRTDAELRRGRGALEELVVKVTDDFEAGKVDLPEGKTLTPTVIANIIGEMPKEDKPSAGAVAAILNRWDENGYALTHDKPFAFKKVSAAGKKQGLDALKEKQREKAKAERAAAKAEKAK